MIALKFLIPEIFLSLSTFTLLMIGVFLKKSFEIVYRLSILVIFYAFFMKKAEKVTKIEICKI